MEFRFFKVYPISGISISKSEAIGEINRINPTPYFLLIQKND